jgi:PAT family beta-lactamase induction signal transducer AmpG
MGQAAFTAFLMCLCTPSYSATQYALLSALAAIARVFMSPVAGYVVARLGWANFFVIAFLACLPGLAVLLLLRNPIRDIDAREKASAAASR